MSIMHNVILILLLAFAFAAEAETEAEAETIKVAYLDNAGNVHIKDLSGNRRQITATGNATSPIVAADGKDNSLASKKRLDP